MSTVAQSVQNVRRRLLAGTREEINLISGSLSAGATTVTFKNPLGGIQQGALICVNYELMSVLSVTSTGSSYTATVQRGWLGSTAATANDGDVVLVNTKWSNFDVFNEINDELDSLSALGIFQAKSADFTYNPVIEGYDLAITDATIDELLEVRYQTVGPMKDWPLIDPSTYELQRLAYTSDFTDGTAFQMRVGGFSGRDVRIAYKAPFTRSAVPTSDDLTTTCGLPATCVDVVELGAALRMVYPREVARNVFEQQSGTTKGQDAPAAAIVNAAKSWEAMYSDRVQRELDRLERRWPHRHRF